MLKDITPKQQQRINEIFQSMSLADKIGQVQCVNASALSADEIRRLIDEEHIGAFFGGNIEKEKLKAIWEAAKDSKIPVIINGDLVNGAGSRILSRRAKRS